MSISSFLTYIGGPLLTIISVFVAIVSIAITFKSKRERKPRYSILSYNIIKDFVNMFDALEIRYAGQTVKDLTVSKIIFWNAGRETIDKDDIVKADPITIRMSDNYKILDQNIIAMNNETDNFYLIPSEDGSKVIVEFDYIDKNDGAVFQIIHTGKSNKDIEFHGRIKGAGEPELKDLDSLSKKLETLGLVITIIGAFSLISVLVYLEPLFDSNPNYKHIFFIIILPIVFLGFIKTARIISKWFKKLPKGLEIFADNIANRDNEGENAK